MVPACGRLLAGIVLAVAVHAAGAHGAVWQAEHRLAEFAREATIDRTPSVISRVAAMTLRSGIDRTVSDMLEQPVAAGFILRGGAIEKAKSAIEETYSIPPFLNETMAVPEESPEEIEQTPLVVRSRGILASLDYTAIGLVFFSSGELVDALMGSRRRRTELCAYITELPRSGQRCSCTTLAMAGRRGPSGAGTARCWPWPERRGMVPEETGATRAFRPAKTLPPPTLMNGPVLESRPFAYR